MNITVGTTVKYRNKTYTVTGFSAAVQESGGGGMTNTTRNDISGLDGVLVKRYYLQTLQKQRDELLEACKQIARGCENFTSGDCWKAGRDNIDSEYTAERPCDACIAQSAIASVEGDK
jgi:hypothetical protein